MIAGGKTVILIDGFPLHLSFLATTICYLFSPIFLQSVEPGKVSKSTEYSILAMKARNYYSNECKLFFVHQFFTDKIHFLGNYSVDAKQNSGLNKKA